MGVGATIRDRAESMPSSDELEDLWGRRLLELSYLGAVQTERRQDWLRPEGSLREQNASGER